MLVITRRQGQKIVIDGDIVVSFEVVRPNLVRVGIDADRDIPVHRAEVQERVREENGFAEPSFRQRYLAECKKTERLQAEVNRLEALRKDLAEGLGEASRIAAGIETKGGGHS